MFSFIQQAADSIKAAMESEALLTSGSASNMVAGETPTGIVTANGVTKVSCIDPRDSSAIEGFQMPDMSDGQDEPECQGASVSFIHSQKYISFYPASIRR